MNKTTKRVLVAILAILFCGGLGYLIFGNQNPKNEENTDSGHVTTIKKTDEGQDKESVDQEDVDDTSEEAASSNDKVAFGSNGEILTGANTKKKPNDKKTSNKEQINKAESISRPNDNINGSDNGNADSGDGDTPTPDPMPIVEQNDVLRINIAKKYGVEVAGKNELMSFKVANGQYTPEQIATDENMQIALNSLNTSLSRYPDGFFKTMKNDGVPLTIYLFKRVNVGDTGMYGMTEGVDSDIKLSINVNSYNQINNRMLDHELMHYIDRYLRVKGINAETTTEALNVSGFVYGDGTKDFVYTPGGNIDNSYVVSDYGKTNYKEDRAELFRYMMDTVKADFFVVNKPLNNKAQLIAEQIEAVFGANVYPWEKYIAY